MKVITVDNDIELSNLLKKTIWVSFYAKAKALAREHKQITDGLDVQQFESQTAALAYIQSSQAFIDLIFTEIHALDTKGLEFIQTCQTVHRKKFGALVIVIERGRQQDIDQGLAAGAQACLLKPFSPEDLIEHIFNAWNRPEHTDEEEDKEAQ
ncbi:response regulator [bacterium]|nr:response regulator [bacterium]